MKFCSKCENMYYTKIDPNPPNKIMHYCRNCGTEDLNIGINSYRIRNVSTNITDYKHIINKYTKYDPTLPRVNNVVCPNHECLSNTKTGKNKKTEKNEKDMKNHIILIRYDATNLKYIYLCSICDNAWNT